MLPAGFLERPIAHRALHDPAQGRPENSRAAIAAAIAGGYGIEIDLQLSGDGHAMVFHDYDLLRLTGAPGLVRDHSAADLQNIRLLHGAEGIPTLAEVLTLVAGRVPLLIEVKDQDGAMGPDVGPLEAATLAALHGYDGPVALMSFNPHSVAELARLAPSIPRGLTTCGYLAKDWPDLSEEVRAHLREIAEYDWIGACFVSHNWRYLDAPRVGELAAKGADILCWTIRSAEDEAKARRVAANITFEGYTA